MMSGIILSIAILLGFGVTTVANADRLDEQDDIETMITNWLEEQTRVRDVADRQREELRRQQRAQDQSHTRAREMRRLIAQMMSETERTASKLHESARTDLRLDENSAWSDVWLGAFQDDATELPAAEVPMDKAELSRQASNPVGNLWMVFMQHDITIRDIEGAGDNQILHNFKLQPVMPITLTDEWRLILRPVIQVNAFDVPQADGSFDTDFGLGDTVVLMAFSNSDPTGEWMIGFGPTWIFPTATDPTLGGDEWAVGPAALAFYLGEKWIYGVVLQNWFSFAGDGEESVNLMDLQYVLRHRVTPTVNIGFGPNIQYDWAADDWSIPVGIGGDVLFSVGDLTLRVGAEFYYYVDEFAGVEDQYGIRLFMVPIIGAPSWASKPLFGK